jgi:hypothetical protein
LGYESISKKDLIGKIKENRTILESLISNIPESDMSTPVEGDWTVKDIFSHIIAWEQNMIRWMNITLAGGAPDDFPETREAVDALNEFQFQRDKGNDLDDVLSHLSTSYAQSLSFAEKVDEFAINDADVFAWREGRPLWYIIAANTYWHYEEHFELFQKWNVK